MAGNAKDVCLEEAKASCITAAKTKFGKNSLLRC
jgi:hypothetical protein